MDSNLQQAGLPGEDPASQKTEKLKYFLVADDDEGDRLLLKKALEENQIHQDFRFVKGGVELIDLLNQSTGRLISQSYNLPSLIILDLYMPRLDGHRVLRIIKEDARFKKIPVIVLTTSSSLADVVNSYNNGANSFLTKPLNYGDLVKLIGLVKEYWLEESHLPI
jgi:two-component system, response regulator